MPAWIWAARGVMCQPSTLLHAPCWDAPQVSGGTWAYSLLLSSSQMARFAAPLCFNFLHVIRMNDVVASAQVGSAGWLAGCWRAGRRAGNACCLMCPCMQSQACAFSEPCAWACTVWSGCWLWQAGRHVHTLPPGRCSLCHTCTALLREQLCCSGPHRIPPGAPLASPRLPSPSRPCEPPVCASVSVSQSREMVFFQKMGAMNSDVPILGQEFNTWFPLTMLIYVALLTLNWWERCCSRIFIANRFRFEAVSEA